MNSCGYFHFTLNITVFLCRLLDSTNICFTYMKHKILQILQLQLSKTIIKMGLDIQNITLYNHETLVILR